jgi:hypothetical protein
MAMAIAHKVIAARPTRKATMVNGGKAVTATSTKKKEPPHSTDSVISISHSRAPIVRWIEDAM